MKVNGLLIICSVFFLLSCSKENEIVVNDNECAALVVDTKLDVSALGGKAEVLCSGKCEAKISEAYPWLTLSQVDGRRIVLDVKPNYDYTSRIGQVEIVESNQSRMVSVIQLGAVWTSKNSKEMIGIADDNSDYLFEMNSTFPIDASVSNSPGKFNSETDDGQISWASCEVVGNGVKLKLRKNDTGSPRGGYLNMNSGHRNKTISFIQYDVADLVGKWHGVLYFNNQGWFNNDKKRKVLTNLGTNIAKNENGTYTLTMPLTLGKLKLPMELTMSVVDNMFDISLPQPTSFVLLSFKGAVGIGTEDGKHITSGHVYLAPRIGENGKVVLSYVGENRLCYMMTNDQNNPKVANSAQVVDVIQMDLTMVR